MSDSSDRRVLHVVETWRPVATGYTRRGWEIVAGQMAGDQCEPYVLVSSRQAMLGFGHADMPGGHDERLCVVRPSAGERLIRRVRPFHIDRRHLRDAIIAACRRHRIDIIHCHWSSAIGRAARAAAARTGAALVGEVRFDLAGAMMSETVRYPLPRLENRLRRHFERYLAGAHAVVAASHTLAALLEAQRYPVAVPVHTIPNAIDRQRFKPALKDADLRQSLGLKNELVIGSTSNMLRYEGLDLLLDALARLRDHWPALHVVLVGGGTQQQTLRATSRRQNLAVTFAGQVPPDDIPRYLNLFDVFVIPRRAVSVTRYASPIKVVEAQACGVPVIATALGDIPDILAAGGGQCIEPGDCAALAEAIAGLAGDPERRQRMAAHALAWADAQPSWSDLAGRYPPIYEQALARKLGHGRVG